jgi:tetratricopeptide (TPR) repeat protein
LSNPLEAARKAFRRHTWSEAYSLFSAAGKDSPLEPEDDELLAVAGYLLGKDQESADTWIRAHTKYLDRGNIEQAIRSAFWAAFVFFHRQEGTRGSAWIARAHRLLEKVGQDSVEQGYLLLPKALNDIDRGDADSGCSTLEKALAIADHFADRDLIALARHALGRSLIRMGKIQEGARMLDEAMVTIEVGDVSPIVAGDVYCSVISGCMEVFDLRRAQEWTTALTHWCESQPDMVAYNGQCQVHRAEILRFQGAWSEALDATEKACLQCRQGPDRAAIGAAHYQRAEIYRLLGEFPKAEDDYREASRHGPRRQLAAHWRRLRNEDFNHGCFLHVSKSCLPQMNWRRPMRPSPNYREFQWK